LIEVLCGKLRHTSEQIEDHDVPGFADEAWQRRCCGSRTRELVVAGPGDDYTAGNRSDQIGMSREEHQQAAARLEQQKWLAWNEAVSFVLAPIRSPRSPTQACWWIEPKRHTLEAVARRWPDARVSPDIAGHHSCCLGVTRRGNLWSHSHPARVQDLLAPQRRLVAVLAADVVGYARLTELTRNRLTPG